MNLNPNLSESRQLSVLLCLLMVFVCAAANAATPDAATGKRLHDAYCTSCHDTGVYTRKDHGVQSLTGLKDQVNDCTHMAKHQFSTAETESVVRYLNDQFYHF